MRVTVLQEGGHIAEITNLATGVNPLWTPPWPTIEPSQYDRARHPEYGEDAESQLLAGIHGHNLCLDLFGAPSATEAAAGLTVHGEASVAAYTARAWPDGLECSCELREARLGFTRRLTLDGERLWFEETVENLSACDRPIAWTQHVTLGPPFLEPGQTQFRANATRSLTYDERHEFQWPYWPETGEDLRLFTRAAVSGRFSTHLLDPSSEHAGFVAFQPSTRTALGYTWRREDFPWMGLWQENRERQQPPWNGQTVTQGFEFGASPMPESRRKMIDRGSLFGVPAYRWIGARQRAQVRYCAWTAVGDAIPESLRHA